MSLSHTTNSIINFTAFLDLSISPPSSEPQSSVLIVCISPGHDSSSAEPSTVPPVPFTDPTKAQKCAITNRMPIVSNEDLRGNESRVFAYVLVRILPSALAFIKRSLAFPFPHCSHRKLSVRLFLRKLRHVRLERSKAESCAVSSSWMLRFRSCCELSVVGITRGYINESNSTYIL